MGASLYPQGILRWKCGKPSRTIGTNTQLLSVFFFLLILFLLFYAYLIFFFVFLKLAFSTTWVPASPSGFHLQPRNHRVSIGDCLLVQALVTEIPRKTDFPNLPNPEQMFCSGNCSCYDMGSYHLTGHRNKV